MEQEKIEQKIEEIEEQIRSLPYHKGTEHHIGKLKAQLAKLRKQVIGKSQSGKSGGGGFAVRKQGDATVVLVGFPSVGKSTFLNQLTNAESKVGAYPFTTLDVIPGMLEYRQAKIQIFDVPGLITGASTGKGGGKEILSVVRIADLLLLIASAENPETFEIMEQELYSAGVRLNNIRPKITFEKKLKGGIEILGNTGLSEAEIKSIVREFKMPNIKISFQQKVTQDELIDSLIGNRAYVLAIRVISKSDLISLKRKQEIIEKFGQDGLLFISSKNNIGIEELKQTIFKKLQLIRIYLRQSLTTKPENEPLVCKKGITVIGAAEKISNALANEIKGAKIKGASARYPNQIVGLRHILKDKDQIFFMK